MNDINEVRNCKSNIIVGIILIMLGGVLLARNFMPNIAVTSFWPLLFIGMGAVVLLRVLRSNNDL